MSSCVFVLFIGCFVGVFGAGLVGWLICHYETVRGEGGGAGTQYLYIVGGGCIHLLCEKAIG